jgi:hypothetical protein
LISDDLELVEVMSAQQSLADDGCEASAREYEIT